MSVLNFDAWRFNLWASQSACSVFEIALVMELLLSRSFPAASIRARSRRPRQSECRGQSRETNGAVIPVTCVTNWSSETSSGQVRVLTNRTGIKTSDYLDSVGENHQKKASNVPNFPQLTSSLRSIAIMLKKERGLTQPVTSPRLVLPPRSVQASQRMPLPPLPAVKPLRNPPKTTEQYTKESQWRFKSSVASGLHISPSLMFPCRTLICLHIWWRLFFALYLATGHQLCLSSAFSCFPVC